MFSKEQGGMEREGGLEKEKEKERKVETGWLLDDGKNGATGLHWIVRDGPVKGLEWSEIQEGWVRRTISILIPPWGVDVARTNRREDANTDGTPLETERERERERVTLLTFAPVYACFAPVVTNASVDLYPFYCRGILAFANTEQGHAAPGFSPHDGISLFPSQGILNGFPFPPKPPTPPLEKKKKSHETRHACLHAFFPALRA